VLLPPSVFAAQLLKVDTRRMDPRLQHEIEHGRYLVKHRAGEIWNWESPAGRIRWQRRVRMLGGDIRAGMRVLELGCGTGHFTRELASTGATIIAIDISPELLATAEEQCRATNVHFEIQNAYAFTYPEASFDAVVGSSVLHHLVVEQALAQIYRVLGPRGIIRFTEPNMLNPQIAIQKNVPVVKRRLGDSPDESAFFRWSLMRRLRRTGFRDVQVTPFDFLHPWLPSPLIRPFQTIGTVLERLPLISEIAGSLYICATK
jgi:2-polyprenyl-3-methyl-5-hydroxy-6-metoxy-1,4-benzoquinol methylase